MSQPYSLSSMQISVPAFSDELTLLPFINLKSVRAIQRDSPPTAASREGECSEAEPEEIAQCASIWPANATVPAAALFLAVLATTPVVDLTGGFFTNISWRWQLSKRNLELQTVSFPSWTANLIKKSS